jgi:hypothetical protein
MRVESGHAGRFSQRLMPGRYRVEVSAPGFQTYSPKKELVIEPLRGPIWVEHATMVRPIDGYGEYAGSDPYSLTPDEATATYGLELVIGLSARSARRGFHQVGISSP